MPLWGISASSHLVPDDPIPDDYKVHVIKAQVCPCLPLSATLYLLNSTLPMLVQGNLQVLGLPGANVISCRST